MGILQPCCGYVLVCRVGMFDLRSTDEVVALGVGALFWGVLTARLFGRFHGGNFFPLITNVDQERCACLLFSLYLRGLLTKALRNTLEAGHFNKQINSVLYNRHSLCSRMRWSIYPSSGGSQCSL